MGEIESDLPVTAWLHVPEPDSPEELEERARTLVRDAELVRVAQALGVEPMAKNEPAAVALVTSDGRSYSWTALVQAHIRLLADGP